MSEKPISDGLTDQDVAACRAFLEERLVILDVFRECLDLIAHLETYWQYQRNHGDRNPFTVVAQGKLFQKVHEIHKLRLRRRILEAKEKLDRAERDSMRVMQGKREGRPRPSC